MKYFLLSLVLALSQIAYAGTLSFDKLINVDKLQGELKVDEDMDFQGTCSTCHIHGKLYYNDTLAHLDLTVYESTSALDVRITSSTFSVGLQNSLTTTVTNHVP